jgi:hypothetical protein
MKRACGNDDRISVSRRALSLLVKNEFGLPLLDSEELIHVRVHLVTDVFSRLQAHHYKLGVLSGIQHLAKVGVLQSLFLNRSNVFNHGSDLQFPSFASSVFFRVAVWRAVA